MPTQPTTHDHIVHSYDEERHRLAGELLRMGEMAAAQLEAALDVVERRDDGAAARIVANDDAIDALADLAAEINSTVENIGARRLHTVLEKLLEEISYTASDRTGERIEVTAEMAERKYGCAIVTERGKVIGVLTTVDVCRAFSELEGRSEA